MPKLRVAATSCNVRPRSQNKRNAAGPKGPARLRVGVGDRYCRRIGGRPLINQIASSRALRCRTPGARASRMTREKQHRGPMVRYPGHAVGLAAKTLYFN